MIMTEQSTESQVVQIKETEEEKKTTRARAYGEVWDASFESQPFAMMLSDIRMAYQRLAEMEQRYRPILGAKPWSIEAKVLGDSYGALIRAVAISVVRERVSTYPAFDLTAIEAFYHVKNPSEVLRFIQTNSFLMSFLEEAQQQIREYFSASTKLALQVATDPEIESYQELVISVFTPLSPEKALEKLEEFDEGWWLNTPFSVREKVCIDVEFE